MAGRVRCRTRTLSRLCAAAILSLAGNVSRAADASELTQQVDAMVQDLIAGANARGILRWHRAPVGSAPLGGDRNLARYGPRMDAVDFSPDGTRLAAGGTDGIVRILDPVARREVARFHGHDGRICWLGFSSQGSRVSTALDGTIRIGEPETERRPTVLSSRP